MFFGTKTWACLSILLFRADKFIWGGKFSQHKFFQFGFNSFLSFKSIFSAPTYERRLLESEAFSGTGLDKLLLI